MPRRLSAKQERAVQFRLPAYVQARLEDDTGKYGLTINDIARCYAIAAAWNFRGAYVAKLVTIAAARKQDFLTICELLTEKIRTARKVELDGEQGPYPPETVECQLADLLASCVTREKKSTSKPRKTRQRRVSRVVQIQFRVPSALRARIATLRERVSSTDNDVCRRLVLTGYWNLPPHLLKRISLAANERNYDFETMCAIIAAGYTIAMGMKSTASRPPVAESALELIETGLDLRGCLDHEKPLVESAPEAPPERENVRTLLLDKTSGVKPSLE